MHAFWVAITILQKYCTSLIACRAVCRTCIHLCTYVLHFRYKYAFVWIAISCCKLSDKHECRNEITIQQYLKTKAATIFIAITSTLHSVSVRRIRTSLTRKLEAFSVRFRPTPAFSTPAFSTPAILVVSHFPLPYFRSALRHSQRRQTQSDGKNARGISFDRFSLIRPLIFDNPFFCRPLSRSFILKNSVKRSLDALHVYTLYTRLKIRTYRA